MAKNINWKATKSAPESLAKKLLYIAESRQKMVNVLAVKEKNNKIVKIFINLGVQLEDTL